MKQIIATWIKCRNCRKKYTQSIFKNRKTYSVCPNCHSVNNPNQ